MIDLILGGARSGKSRLAEQWAADSGKSVVYVATAQSHDHEMTARIAHHQHRRPEQWITVEQPVALDQALKHHDNENTLILVDCLTLWISNLLCLGDAHAFQEMKQRFLQQLSVQQSQVILVSNETGMGVVPMGELTRRFVDESGWLHQELAQIAQRVTLVVAGLPHTLKQVNA